MKRAWIACVAIPLLAAAAAADRGADTATIVDSGSTNVPGYAIEVSRAGRVSVEARDGAAAREASVAPELAGRLFAALDGPRSLDALPASHCMKSASFGHSLRIRYRGASSPDLTCATDDQGKQLAALAGEIARAAGLADPPIVE